MSDRERFRFTIFTIWVVAISLAVAIGSNTHDLRERLDRIEAKLDWMEPTNAAQAAAPDTDAAGR